MRDEKEERKKEASKVKQTNKAKQHSTPKAVTFPRTNELHMLHALARVGLEPMTPCTLDRAVHVRTNNCTLHSSPTSSAFSYIVSSPPRREAGWLGVHHSVKVHLRMYVTCNSKHTSSHRGGGLRPPQKVLNNNCLKHIYIYMYMYMYMQVHVFK